jgi:hypothetical protein
MGIKALMNSAGVMLESIRSTTQGDLQGDRTDVLQDLHLAEKAWATNGVVTGPWFMRDGDHVAFTPTTRNGATLTIADQTATFVPAARFADYLVNMRTAVESGEFDHEIAAALHGSANVGGIAEVPLPAERDGDPDTVRRAQQDAALAREGRNPDGSLTAVR